MQVNLKEEMSNFKTPKFFPQCVAVAVGCAFTVHIAHRVWKKVSLNRKINEKKQHLKSSMEKVLQEIQQYQVGTKIN